LNILLLRTWKTNIGNGFIDKGAKASLRRAFPDSQITEVSAYSQYIESNVNQDLLAGVKRGELSVVQKGISRLRKRCSETKDYRFTSVGDMISLETTDLAVLPGCVLYEHALSKYERILNRLESKNIPLLVLGAGGGDYGTETQQYTRRILQNHSDIGLISRDHKAFEAYRDDVDEAEPGIDNAFFIDDWHKPAESEKDFVVANFDKTREPPMETEKMIIRTSHTPFGEPFGSLLNRKFSDKFRVEEENFFVSDNLRDYLFMYANAQEVYSDRVHACLPALVYGAKAKFVFNTPRAALFDSMGVEWEDTPVGIDSQRLLTKKEHQVENIKEMVSSIVHEH